MKIKWSWLQVEVIEGNIRNCNIIMLAYVQSVVRSDYIHILTIVYRVSTFFCIHFSIDY